MHSLPFESAPIADAPVLDSWLGNAPQLVATMLERWKLTAGEAFVGGASASVLSVTRADGSPAILKVGFPHVEAIWEAVGLQAFPEGTAPALLEQDVWTWSMLLEPVTPGTPLNQSELTPEEALIVGGRLHARLAAAPAPPELPRLADAMHDYAEQAMARRAAQTDELDGLNVADLVDEAVRLLEALAADEVEGSLLHGDYNPGNILAADTGPRNGNSSTWRVIDPKPLVGDACYDLWPLVSQTGSPFDSPDPVARLIDQVSTACAAAGCDPARVAAWSFARTGLNVTWYLAAGQTALALAEASALVTWDAVLATFS